MSDSERKRQFHSSTRHFSPTKDRENFSMRNHLRISLLAATATAAAASTFVIAAPAAAQGATCGTYSAGTIVQPAQGTPGTATSTACGPGAVAPGVGATAVGDRAVASGNFSSAFGDFSAATGLQSTAVGDVAS